MHVSEKKQNCGATGYILLWLLGIPIPNFAGDPFTQRMHLARHGLATQSRQ
jgi:hypothetical protein